MKTTVLELAQGKAALFEQTRLDSVQDALDIIANADRGCDAASAILAKEDVADAFFDLKTGLAGELLQKFTNYGMRLAIVGDFSDLTSHSLRDFIYESNKGGKVLFVASVQVAVAKWNETSP